MDRDDPSQPVATSGPRSGPAGLGSQLSDSDESTNSGLSPCGCPAGVHGAELERLSLKGTVDTLRQWTPLFAPAMSPFRRARQELLRIIVADRVPDRPNRSEPRARKRRPKCYQMLTRPRHQMVVSASRGLK